jgi:hypothetical protein
LFAAIENIYKCKLLLTWTSHNSSALCFPLTLFYLCPFFKKSCIIILLIHVVPILHATVYKTVRKQRNILRNRGIEGCRAALLLLRAPLFLNFFFEKAGTVQVFMTLSKKAMYYLPSFDPHTVGCAQQCGLLYKHVRDMGSRVACS